MARRRAIDVPTHFSALAAIKRRVTLFSAQLLRVSREPTQRLRCTRVVRRSIARSSAVFAGRRGLERRLHKARRNMLEVMIGGAVLGVASIGHCALMCGPLAATV